MPRPTLKLGRKPRLFADLPHVASLRMRAGPLPTLPLVADNAAALPPFVGMMRNDSLGDCTCAGMAHLIQIWTQDAGGAMLTEPDAQVVQAYHEVAGYDPATGQPDDGAAEQDVLRWWQQTGFPMADGSRHRIGPVYEANPRNLLGLCEVVMEFGASYVGINVPSGLMEELPPVWWDNPAYGAIEGGHCVLVHSFDRTDPAAITFGVTTWGTNRQYRMRGDFVARYMEEAYGIVSSLWIERTGRTPYGLDLATLEGLGGTLGQPLGVASAMRVDMGALEAARYGVARSSHWPSVARDVLARIPDCIACDPDQPEEHVGLQVHHMRVSFHVAKLLGRPDLELDERNLTTLGETEEGRPAPNHHLEVGHGGNFQKDCNPWVDDDAARMRGWTVERIRADPVWQQHAAACPPPWAEWTRDMKITRRKELDTKFPMDGDEYRAVVARFPDVEAVPFDSWLASLGPS